jgi:hypothetical protein
MYAVDDSSPPFPFSFELEAGETSSTREYHLWNDLGGLLADTTTLRGARLRAEVLVGGVWSASGLPVVDERQVRVTIVGKNAAGDVTMRDQLTGTLPLGDGAEIALDDIPKNCARHFQMYVDAPGGSPTLSETLRIVLIYDGNSIPLVFGITKLVGGGVLPGYRNPAVRRIVRGRNLIADGSDTLVVERGAFDYDATRTNVLRSSHTLDQTDGDGSALAAAETYLATASQRVDGSVTFTKGSKANVPVAPAAPPGEIVIGFVSVRFQAGGVSLIAQSDVDLSPLVWGDYLVVAGAGLSIIVHAGEGVTPTDLYQWSTAPAIVPLTASTANSVWRMPDGSLSATASPTPPLLGADLLAVATTNTVGVVSVDDRRTILSPPIGEHVLELRLDAVLSTAATPLRFGFAVLAFEADLEAVTLDLDEIEPTWDGGQVKLDILAAAPGDPLSSATTIYPGSGTDDQRPVLAHDSLLCSATFLDHERRRFARGTRLVADLISVPTAPAAEPSRAVVLQLRFHRP